MPGRLQSQPGSYCSDSKPDGHGRHAREDATAEQAPVMRQVAVPCLDGTGSFGDNAGQCGHEERTHGACLHQGDVTSHWHQEQQLPNASWVHSATDALLAVGPASLLQFLAIAAHTAGFAVTPGPSVASPLWPLPVTAAPRTCGASF